VVGLVMAVEYGGSASNVSYLDSKQEEPPVF